jgi:class 3 adenylate cyclase
MMQVTSEVPLASYPEETCEEADLGFTHMIATVMFTDIEDSTGLAKALGVTGIARFLKHHCALAGRVVTAHHGTFLGCTGDGVLAVWGNALPRHAMPARLALLAAAELGYWITEENAHRRDAGLATRRVRIGLHSGEVAVERDGGCGGLPRIYGATAHDARRVEQAGKGVDAAGKDVVVMASQATLRLAALDPEPIRGVVRQAPAHGCASCSACYPVLVDPDAILAAQPGDPACLAVLSALWSREAGRKSVE